MYFGEPDFGKLAYQGHGTIIPAIIAALTTQSSDNVPVAAQGTLLEDVPAEVMHQRLVHACTRGLGSGRESKPGCNLKLCGFWVGKPHLEGNFNANLPSPQKSSREHQP